MDDQEAMRLAIAHAHSVEGRTAPRPPVGAVVVRDGVVVGQGATSPPYGPHAEVHALNKAGELARGADLYVTLEPCCVTIHTPPCTRAILAAGIRRVIVSSLDPNPLVSGQGLAQLREAGIEVAVGVGAEETDEIIRPFATFIRQQRPYVTAKWAMTLDGKISTHSSDAYWISGPAARRWVHNLRDRVDAILVGSGTVRADDPLLTVRLTDEERLYARAPRQGPLRVVLASQGALPAQSKLLQPGLASGTCIIVGEDCPVEQQQRLRDTGVEVIQVASNKTGQLDLTSTLSALAQKGVMHVLIEGGNSTLGSAFDQQRIDHVAAFIAPKLVGGEAALSPLGGKGLAVMREALQLQQVHIQTIGEDVLIEGELSYGI
ncbi:bifunctional diaminohydroxyphosphoribosylaminopyrimidine deaminase/5-amino-6-(5-phosphoribosylamino)uracil reductase RibD [Ktedonobacter robiniae]|uniref:Riboflavin biosynthesis protein RibD n=1 Tax=Ktedonobacter robiniae TaxID=2778365 RepID=A0ABQ3V372_9CHLR|nr:bifunctional diaminohydroxyphosphoribosylaminopyrimidine deaminase/5-amino-6-(5-phosphoribosylamino)uracil reductase RibD [Ktedonobacter robiniae]GHO59624.1 riboflavin biosynthesis protein RibD [Ktedonobacter robiniae]